MSSKNITKGLLLGASLLLATAAFAGEKANVKIYEDVKVNGKTLAAGKYDLEWTGTGDSAQLSILKGKETVATVPAKIVATKSAPASTGYSTKGEADGSKALTSVFVAGKKYSFELGQEVAAAPVKTESAGNR
ncbi:MAG TPA: hypothetical protein VEU98_05525 [Candidatus Eremiobacteraceae bacterium]|nr:hypothetical protein [Candidatus Eremiobacteraceae bacterium]